MAYRILLFAMALSAVVMPVQVIPHVNSPSVVLTEQTNGRKMSVRKGTRIEVRLPAQLGTGYMWRVIKTPSVLDPVGEPTVETPKPDAGKTVGGKEIQNFRFVAARTGTGVLELAYARGWEKDARPRRSFFVTLSVTE